MPQDFSTWLGSLGKVTRVLLGCSVFLTAASSFSIFSPVYYILFDASSTIRQPWRPLTAALYLGEFSLPWLMNIGMFVTYLSQNENDEFSGKPADFVWMLFFLTAVLTLTAVRLNVPVTSFSLIMALCWIFCKRNPDRQLSLFGFVFRATYFPFALLAFHVILGGSGVIHDVLGIVAGHLYIFLQDVLPRTHKLNLLRTPQWLQRAMLGSVPRTFGLYPETHPSDPRFARTGRNAYTTFTGSHRWGGGQRLGSN